MKVFEIKEQLNIEKTSVTDREIFKHENDYKDRLKMLKKDLATLDAKYNEVLDSLEEEFPRKQEDFKIFDRKENVYKDDSQSPTVKEPGKAKFLKSDLNDIRSFIKVI